MKYKVGDKVRIKKSNSYLWSQNMNKWVGEIMTIRALEERHYKMLEDIDDFEGNKTKGWNWYEEMIECKVDDGRKETNFEHLIEYIQDVQMDYNGIDTMQELTIKFYVPLEEPICLSSLSINSFKEWLKQPYQKPKIKLTQFEYDILSCCNEAKRKKKFNYFTMLKQMKYKGYYKGVHDVTMTVEEILNNCEIENEKI